VRKMFKTPEKIIHALPEQIGNPKLFVGRKEEFNFFLGDWYQYLENNFAQNQAIVSRRKKGKTAFLQRLFNILWSAGVETEQNTLSVIPFYYSIKDRDISLDIFAKDFFMTFANQYLSFKMKNVELLRDPITYETFKDEVQDKTLLKRYKTLEYHEQMKEWEVMWTIASETPAAIGVIRNEKIVQIIDEFQNINEHILDKEREVIKNLSGTYMQVGEKREAPLIVSGSEVHWLLKIVRSLTGRFQTYNLGNLPKDETDKAVEVYAEASNTSINNSAKEKIWELTRGDPLYIKALFLSRFNIEKDYTEDENIIDVYEQELSKGEIYTTWMEYMLNTFDTVNKINSKRIMLYLFNQGQEKTRDEIRRDLKLPYTDQEAEEKLNALIAGDLISQGSSAFRYKVTKDKTYEMVFRSVYQDEIEHFVPDIKAEIRKLIGKENYIKGKYAEFLLREKLKKPFILSDVCETDNDLKIIPKEIKEREFVSLGTRKYEIDLILKCESDLEVWIDVKDTKNKYGKAELKRWLRIAEMAKSKRENILFMVYSRNGFTKDTGKSLLENNVYILKSEK
ncbi:MAG TPA: hypothetical protein PK466_08380, partial [Thermotogota bacterium]|nr:hypothetical protein [Thermotogota bacterium]